MPRLDVNGAERLDCGHLRDGRPEVAYVSCGHTLCEIDAGAHECRVGKHATLPPFERKRVRP